MQIQDGKGKNQFVQPTQYSVVTHPEFGIDEIRSDTLRVDILADDAGSKANLNRDNVNAPDYFRTLPKPPPPPPSMGERLKQWFVGLFE